MVWQVSTNPSTMRFAIRNDAWLVGCSVQSNPISYTALLMPFGRDVRKRVTTYSEHPW